MGELYFSCHALFAIAIFSFFSPPTCWCLVINDEWKHSILTGSSVMTLILCCCTKLFWEFAELGSFPLPASEQVTQVTILVRDLMLTSVLFIKQNLISWQTIFASLISQRNTSWYMKKIMNALLQNYMLWWPIYVKLLALIYWELIAMKCFCSTC